MADEHAKPADTSASSPAPTVPETGIQAAPPAGAVTPAPPADAVIPVPPPPSPEPAASPAVSRFPDLSGLTDRFLIVLVLAFTFLLGSFAINNSDLWLHLSTGRLLAQGQYTFGVDPLSFATRDVYWANHSWLFDWLTYLLYTSAGGAGLVLARAVVLVLLAALLLRSCWRQDGVWLACASIGLAMLVMSPRFLMQSTCVSFALLGVTLYLLTCGGRFAIGPRSPAESTTGSAVPWRLWLLPPLFALWVNLDAFFILGPVLVACFLIGVLVQRFTGKVPSVCPVQLSIILVVGLAACLLNPHFFRAFTLPPELAYMVVTVQDWIGVGLPDWMVSGGVTVKSLRAEPTFPLVMSPFSSHYVNVPAFGKNAAGLAYFALLGLSLLSFALPMGKTLPPIHWPRLLIWVPFAILSMLQTRLIPFFAVVAGPVLVLNLLDNMRAQQTDGAPAPSRRGLMIAGRAATALVFLLLLALAWPGWLHGVAGDFRSSRRVAWGITIDPSLRQASEKLQELHNKKLISRGFDFSQEMAAYCCWFAPDVKTFFDYRYTLFPHIAPTFVKVRRSLAESSQPAFGERETFAEWRLLAKDFDIDHLVVTGFQSGNTTVAVARCWRNRRHWPMLYADGRTLIFAWAPDGPPGPLADRAVDVDRLAFGAVPDDQRAPAHGTDFPTSAPSWFENYLYGKSSPPLAMYTAQFYHLYHQYASLYQWQQLCQALWYTTFLLGPVSTAAVSPAPVQIIAGYRHGFLLAPAEGERFRPLAGPILRVRSARRAVADAPQQAQSYLVLSDSCNSLWRTQEDALAQDRGQGSSLRAHLRQVQVLAAMRTYLNLEPEDPLAHEALAETYLNLHYLDIALDHLTLAARYLNQRLAAISDRQGQQAVGQKLKLLEQRRKGLAAELKKRGEEFDLRAAGLKPLARFQLAMVKAYKPVELGNRDQGDVRGLGLAKKALTILQETRIEQLNVGEKYYLVTNQLELLLMMGRVQEVRDALPGLKGLLGPAIYRFQLLAGAAVGDYDAVDDALDQQIKGLALDKNFPNLARAIALNVLPAHSLPDLVDRAITACRHKQIVEANFQQAAGLHLMRGLMAVERGDTTLAQHSFQEGLRFAVKGIYVPDRPIAVRYLDLLRKAHKK